MKNLAGIVSVLFLSSGLAAAHAEDWTGKLVIHDQSVPIHLSLSAPGADGSVTGAFINGEEKSVSNKGVLKNGHLVLNFDYFARRLEGDIKDGKLEAVYAGARSAPTSFSLQKDALATTATSVKEVSKIAGDWEIAVKSPKGESAWTLRVTQPTGKQREAKAVVLRIDGDTGGLYGGFDAATQEYRFARFGASGAALYGVKLDTNGTVTLSNLLRPDQHWTGRRPSEARKENLAPPTKTEEQTTIVDPSKPLAFSAPDLNGHEITNNDPRFSGKVVIVAVGGSWCPNCHDEAPLLVDLYKRYHSKGLEVVSLSFEEEDQLKDPVRLRAFQEKYGITYPVLVAGTPDQLNQKLPQGKNLNCWPTAFFVGRDGLVKEAHAGFAGPATGQAYVDLKDETEKLIENLLKQATPAQAAASTQASVSQSGS